MNLIKSLNEGLRKWDLKDLVLPIISIDEYDSKISDDGLVIGFKVEDKKPAEDLSRFIEKSGQELLDAEVSPGPDEDGNYWVFVELVRDNKAPKKILKILELLEKVTAITKWSMEIYKKPGKYLVTKENLKKYVRLEERSARSKTAESIAQIIKNSYADRIELRENTLRLNFKEYEIECFGTVDEIYKIYNFNIKPLRLDEGARNNIRPLEGILGADWLVSQIEDSILCQHLETDNLIVLRA